MSNIRRPAGIDSHATYTLNAEPFAAPVMRIYSDASRTVLAAGPFTLAAGASPTQFIPTFPSTLTDGFYWLKFSTVFNEGDEALDDIDDTLTLYVPGDLTETFATIDDLASALGRVIDEGDLTAGLALTLSTGVIRAYTRQHISRVDEDQVTLDAANRHALLLPEIPVRDVTDVTVSDEALTVSDDVYWYADGRLYRVSGAAWGTFRQSVAVTYSHGYDQVPDDIRAICIGLAVRLLANPESLRQESIGSYSRTFAGGAVSELTDGEMRILDTYRVRGLA